MIKPESLCGTGVHPCLHPHLDPIHWALRDPGCVSFQTTTFSLSSEFSSIRKNIYIIHRFYVSLLELRVHTHEIKAPVGKLNSSEPAALKKLSLDSST